MSKDPAILFYTSDFISGTLTMTDEQRGRYILLLCLQHQNGGYLTKDDMLNICKTYDKKVFSKFKQNGDENYYNERMLNEIDKRKAYSESRRKNRLGEKDISNISKTYVIHMENENGDVIEKEIKINTWQDLAKYARQEYRLEFNKEKWKYEIPPPGTVNTKERADHFNKWKPIVTELNQILDKL